MIITGMEEGCSVFTKTNKYLMMSDWHAVFAGPRREQMRSQQDHKLICVYLCWCICVSRLTSACALCTPAYLNMCAFTCMFSLRRWKCVCVYAWPSSLSDHKGPKLMMIDLSERWFFFYVNGPERRSQRDATLDVVGPVRRFQRGALFLESIWNP